MNVRARLQVSILIGTQFKQCDLQRAIRAAGGLTALTALLRQTPDAHVREEATAALWNLSSCDVSYFFHRLLYPVFPLDCAWCSILSCRKVVVAEGFGR